jgi:SNF2 family DNA or RNA helicase
MLTEFQNDIVKECLGKKSGGLSLPMGTGKTIIALHVALEQSPELPIIVIASKTLLHSWENEIRKFYGDTFPYQILHKEKIPRLETWTLDSKIRIVLTTTEVLSKYYRQYNVQDHFVLQVDNQYVGYTNVYQVPTRPILSPNTVEHGPGLVYTKPWGCLIVDEAHGYCNITVDKSRCIAALCAPHRWLLSGTLFCEPNPNNILGFYTLLNYPDTPRDMTGMWTYMRNRDFKGLRPALVIRTTTGQEKPVYKINHELVQKPLYEEEIIVYEMIKRVLKRISDYMRSARDYEGRRQYASYLLAMITYLRQILIAPHIVLASVAVDVCKIKDASQLSMIIMNEMNVAGLGEWLASHRSLYSSRIQSILDKIDEFQTREKRIIIFSAFRTSLKLLSALVEESFPGVWQGFTLESNQSIPKKAKILEDFAKSEQGILYLTYKTGSEGLNLQHTNTVFLMDSLWNAASGEQAIARVARRGQQSMTVNVLTFISNTGIEKAMLEKHINKITIAEELMNGPTRTNFHTMKVDDVVKMVMDEDTAGLYQQIRERV